MPEGFAARSARASTTEWQGTFDDIVASARRTTGLEDFGDAEHEEGLRILVDDYRDNAGLTEDGCKRMRGGLKGLLMA